MWQDCNVPWGEHEKSRLWPTKWTANTLCNLWRGMLDRIGFYDSSANWTKRWQWELGWFGMIWKAPKWSDSDPHVYFKMYNFNKHDYMINSWVLGTTTSSSDKLHSNRSWIENVRTPCFRFSVGFCMYMKTQKTNLLTTYVEGGYLSIVKELTRRNSCGIRGEQINSGNLRHQDRLMSARLMHLGMWILPERSRYQDFKGQRSWPTHFPDRTFRGRPEVDYLHTYIWHSYVRTYIHTYR